MPLLQSSLPGLNAPNAPNTYNLTRYYESISNKHRLSYCPHFYHHLSVILLPKTTHRLSVYVPNATFSPFQLSWEAKSA